MPGPYEVPHEAGTFAPRLIWYLNQLRYLTKENSFRDLLVGPSYRRPAPLARAQASAAVPHLAQGLVFLEAARSSARGVSPLLRYYAYLNMAMAVIAAHAQSPDALPRGHGAADATPKLAKLSLGVPVVRIKEGAISRFDEIVGGGGLVNENLRLYDLVAAMPILATELDLHFSVRTYAIDASLHATQPDDASESVVLARFALAGGGSSRVQQRAIEKLLPDLRKIFKRTRGDASERRYQLRTPAGTARDDWMRENRVRFFDIGARHGGSSHFLQYSFQTAKGARMLHSIVAGIIFAFCGASLVRYRPRLVAKIEASKLVMLFETFQTEADHFMIPAFRNILYRKEFVIESKNFE